MIRKEIENLSAVESYYFETNIEKRWYEIGYINGLRDADIELNLESLWHNASEIPELKDSILIQFAEGRCDVYTIYIKAQADLWHDWCKKYEVLRWAYVKDLLPKGGKK